MRKFSSHEDTKSQRTSHSAKQITFSNTVVIRPQKGRKPLRGKNLVSSCELILTRQRLHHIVPVIERFVKALDRYPLIPTMGAFIIGDDYPSAVDAVNG